MKFLCHDFLEERRTFLALSAYRDVRCKEMVLPRDSWTTLSSRIDPLWCDVFSRIPRLVIDDLAMLSRSDVFHMLFMWCCFGVDVFRFVNAVLDPSANFGAFVNVVEYFFVWDAGFSETLDVLIYETAQVGDFVSFMTLPSLSDIPGICNLVEIPFDLFLLSRSRRESANRGRSSLELNVLRLRCFSFSLAGNLYK